MLNFIEIGPAVYAPGQKNKNITYKDIYEDKWRQRKLTLKARLSLSSPVDRQQQPLLTMMV